LGNWEEAKVAIEHKSLEKLKRGWGRILNLEPIPHSSWCDSPGWEELLLCKLAQLFTICYPQCHQCSISMCQLLYWQ